MAIWIERLLGLVKYSIAIFMMVVGVTTTIATPIPTAHLGWLLSNQLTFIILGVIYFTCGGMLLFGKMYRSRKWTGHGLLAIYLCLVFTLFLNGFALNWILLSWIPNLIFSAIVAALYLRWRFKTAYINPNHFVDSVEPLRDDLPPSRKG